MKPYPDPLAPGTVRSAPKWVCPLFISIAVAVVLVSGIFPHRFAEAQTNWIIEPGEGWGPLRIGMTEPNALGHLGRPKSVLIPPNVSPPGQIKLVLFDTVTLGFVRSGADYKLITITLTNKSAVTRAGIGVGASLHEVLKAYGDSWSANIVGSRLLLCMEVSASSGTPGQPDFSRVTLKVDYRNLGVSFEFARLRRGAPSTPTVESITVQAVKQCRED